MKVRNLIGVLTSILITGAVASCGGNPPAGGISTYVMEAEYINLDGIQGAGLSSDQGGVEMIYGEGTAEHKAKWSNGYYVGYTHSADLQLDFVFNSSSNNTANLVLRLGSELGDIILNSTNFAVKVNGNALNYGNLSIPNSGGEADMVCYDKPIAMPISILEGENTISLVVLENTFKYGRETGGPCVDCIKIMTSSELTWEDKTDNPSRRGEI